MTRCSSWHPLRCLFAWLFLLSIPSGILSLHAEIKLDFWHSYIHQPSGVIHYSFQVANYKRGLFFGSCGPSTHSLVWEYDIDLAGAGPTFSKDQISIRSELKPVEIISGNITFDQKRNEATIHLRAKLAGVETDLPANGTHRIIRVK